MAKGIGKYAYTKYGGKYNKVNNYFLFRNTLAKIQLFLYTANISY